MRTKKVHKFMKYLVAGLIQFPLDLSLLWFFTDILGIYYLLSASISVIISAGIGFIINKNYAFKKSKVSFFQGYIVFAIITAAKIFAITGFLYVFVDVFKMYYLIARVLTGIIIVFLMYFLHTKLTFRTDFD